MTPDEIQTITDIVRTGALASTYVGADALGRALVALNDARVSIAISGIHIPSAQFGVVEGTSTSPVTYNGMGYALVGATSNPLACLSPCIKNAVTGAWVPIFFSLVGADGIAHPEVVGVFQPLYSLAAQRIQLTDPGAVLVTTNEGLGIETSTGTFGATTQTYSYQAQADADISMIISSSRYGLVTKLTTPYLEQYDLDSIVQTVQKNWKDKTFKPPDAVQEQFFAMKNKTVYGGMATFVAASVTANYVAAVVALVTSVIAFVSLEGQEQNARVSLSDEQVKTILEYIAYGVYSAKYAVYAQQSETITVKKVPVTDPNLLKDITSTTAGGTSGGSAAAVTTSTSEKASDWGVLLPILAVGGIILL